MFIRKASICDGQVPLALRLISSHWQPMGSAGAPRCVMIAIAGATSAANMTAAAVVLTRTSLSWLPSQVAGHHQRQHQHLPAPSKHAITEGMQTYQVFRQQGDCAYVSPGMAGVTSQAVRAQNAQPAEHACMGDTYMQAELSWPPGADRSQQNSQAGPNLRCGSLNLDSKPAGQMFVLHPLCGDASSADLLAMPAQPSTPMISMPMHHWQLHGGSCEQTGQGRVAAPPPYMQAKLTKRHNQLPGGDAAQLCAELTVCVGGAMSRGTQPACAPSSSSAAVDAAIANAAAAAVTDPPDDRAAGTGPRAFDMLLPRYMYVPCRHTLSGRLRPGLHVFGGCSGARTRTHAQEPPRAAPTAATLPPPTSTSAQRTSGMPADGAPRKTRSLTELYTATATHPRLLGTLQNKLSGLPLEVAQLQPPRAAANGAPALPVSDTCQRGVLGRLPSEMADVDAVSMLLLLSRGTSRSG